MAQLVETHAASQKVTAPPIAPPRNTKVRTQESGEKQVLPPLCGRGTVGTAMAAQGESQRKEPPLASRGKVYI